MWEYEKTEAGKEVHRRYAQTEAGKESSRKAVAKYKKASPKKTKAVSVVNNALRDGRLFKKPCPCGETKVEGHHPDYNKPLEVIWLCKECHIHEHKKKEWTIV
ncbi:hypothetical protein LCGC14_1939050 [marine sediment metagenome]|uniref:Uncharacterized protein n=1 Tax=marine sediment metagenome TaxID=412755 RepID=A0A0F9FL40_9ZZZZ